MSVPNQKVIEVNKQPTDKNNIYACINVEAINKAVLDLNKGSTFKVWMYFAKNQNHYTFELSSVAVCAFCNISDKTYREAIKEMIAKRYLVKRGDSNTFDFYEIPEEIKVPKDGTIIECHTSTYHVIQ